MKYRLLRLSLLSMLVMLCGGLSLAAILEATGNEEQGAAGFRDIKIDLTQHSELLTESNVYITVAEDGTIGTTEHAENAAATIKGKAHGSYGSSNFTASVPVQGCVKITYATHDYGNDIVVTNAEGAEVAKFKTTGAKWMSDHNNVVVAYYRTNEPTTLNFSNANYNPYFAVEAIAPEDLPAEVTSYNITFATGDGQGIAPAALEIEAGAKFNAPKNYTLYKEGATLTGWSDGTKTYAVGEEITPEADMTLTAQFTTNEVSLADRTEAVSITYALNGNTGNPKYKFEGKTGIIVSQATVNGKTIDVKADVDATSGKFSDNGSGWHQVNTGTKVTVPSCKNAIVKVTTYNDAASVNFNGEAGTADENTAVYTSESENTTLEITQVANNYWNALEIVLPATSQGGEEPVKQDITGTWDYNNADIMTATMALSGTTEAGEVAAIENNGLQMTVVANGATFRNNGNNIQVRRGAEFRIPVKNAGDLVTIKGYPGYSYYSISGGEEITNTNDNPETEYKAKASDAERGYVSVVSTNDNNYYLSLSVTQYAPKEATTLDNEPVIATFPLNLGTEGQKATFSNADYFLNSKVVCGPKLVILDKSNKAGFDQTRFQPTEKLSNASTDNLIQFIITPKPGFSFTPTKVSLKATRYGTNDGKLDFAWINPDKTTISLATGQTPLRENGKDKDNNPTEKFSEYSYDITGATVGEGACGLAINLYGLANNKQIGFADIVIEGTLSGIEKELPILASFTLNGTEYQVEDVFGEVYEATFELSKKDQMVGTENPLTNITATNGEVGTVTYDGSDTQCVVTIPVIAGTTTLDYILNVVQKPDFTLTYLNTDGTELGTQTVEKDATIGEFAIDFTTATARDGYKVRGWFERATGGRKYTIEDVITSNQKLYAVATEIEVASDSKKYEFNLADPNFYAEDHEAFNPAGDGYYFHDTTHGWAFKNGNTVDLLVGPKASVFVTVCLYGSGTGIVVKKGGEVLETLAGKSDADGGVVAYNYEGEAGTITLEMQCSGEMYIHSIKIANTTNTNYDKDGQWYFVKAGDTSSFLDVLDAANGSNGTANAERVYIFLPNGTYDLGEKCLTPISGNNISIIGESQDGVIIKNLPPAEGIDKTATLKNSGTGNYYQDMTIKNDWDYYGRILAGDGAGRAVCLHETGNNTICKNVTLLSHQDTYYTNNANGNFYWKDSEIHGTVDFICGEGTLFMESSKLTVEERNPDGSGECTLTAPSTAADKNYGYVFNNCTIENNAAKYNLGRAWNNEPRCAYLNTTVNDNKINANRWTSNGMNVVAKEFVEYNTMDEQGTVVSPASNVVNFTYGSKSNQMETILTNEQAANFTLAKVFPTWAPNEMTLQLEAPDAEYADGTVTWTPANNGAIAYMIEKNGEFVGITAGNSMTVEADAEKDKLTIRAANGRGGFGEAKQVAYTATSIQAINAAIERGEQVIYNLAGQRVNKATKGMYIINGQKIVVK